MRRDHSKKYGNRHRPGWPMEFETHRVMVFDQGQAPESYAAGYEAMERRCSECNQRCLGDDGLHEHMLKAHDTVLVLGEGLREAILRLGQDIISRALAREDEGLRCPGSPQPEAGGPPAVFDSRPHTSGAEPQASSPPLERLEEEIDTALRGCELAIARDQAEYEAKVARGERVRPYAALEAALDRLCLGCSTNAKDQRDLASLHQPTFVGHTCGKERAP